MARDIMPPEAASAALERFQHLHPKLIDLSLRRIERLLARIGDPHLRLPPVVHVAGTNGKGSTVAFARAILEAAGQRVHAYTSPHLVRFNERIRVAGRLIGDEALADVLERLESANADEPITYFEATTAAAFLAFAETPADVVLLEVGLGGRYDATNVVPPPAAAVITPISLDHREFLGDRLDGIAAEKAGIIKPGAPVAVGRQMPEAADVISDAIRAAGTRVWRQGREWEIDTASDGLLWTGNGLRLELPHPLLRGRHQHDNAGLAITALAVAGMLPDAAAVARGVTACRWPARLQRLGPGPLTDLAGAAELWLDGGHNLAAAEVLVEAWQADGRRPRLVVGMLQTKDARAFLGRLVAIASTVEAVPVPGSQAGLDPLVLAEAARDSGLRAQAHGSVEAGVMAAMRYGDASPVLICGSLYLAGVVLGLNRETPD